MGFFLGGWEIGGVRARGRMGGVVWTKMTGKSSKSERAKKKKHQADIGWGK